MTEAAAELNVTHAAISQHLRTLEAVLEVALTRREGRTISLTEDGHRLAVALKDGFGRIEEGILELQQLRDNRPLTVSLTPSFAENWLMPRLGGFWAENPEIEVSLRPSTAVTDFRGDGIDLAIRYGNGGWTGVEVEPLMPASFAVVAAPDLIAQRNLGPDADLAAETWFLEKLAGEDRRWATAIGLIGTSTRVSELETHALCLAAARAGFGLTVGPRATVLHDLEAGTLDVIVEGESEFGYFIVTPKPRPPAQAQTFIHWLKRAA